MLITLTVYDLEADPENTWDPMKPGAKERVFLLGMVDLVPETHHNLTTVFEALEFPLPFPNVKFSCDLKLLNLVLGIHGSGNAMSMHSCPYCFGHRFQERDVNGDPIKFGDTGRWREGPWRTAKNCQEWYDKWMTETQEKTGQMKNYISCRYPPMDIFGPEYEDVPYLQLFPPGPLHVGLLG